LREYVSHLLKRALTALWPNGLILIVIIIIELMCVFNLLPQAAFFVPLAVANWQVEKVLLFLGQDPALSVGAAPYARLLLLAVAVIAVCESLARFLQAQGITRPMFTSGLAAAVFHVPVCDIYIPRMTQLVKRAPPLSFDVKEIVIAQR
jgi:hypothetical protein